MTPLRRSIHTAASTPPDTSGQPIIDFVSSDETLDRSGEIITAAGWRLDTYRQNPVFQNAHNYGDVIHTLGRALITEVHGNTLYQRVEFAVEANPLARIAHALYRGHFLNSVSVGFLPIRWENGTPQSTYSRKFLEQDLLEVSAVAIPANPNALALGLKTGAVDKSDVHDLAHILASFCNGAENPGQRRTRLLLQLSSELSKLLKKI